MHKRVPGRTFWYDSGSDVPAQCARCGVPLPIGHPFGAYCEGCQLRCPVCGGVKNAPSAMTCQKCYDTAPEPTSPGQDYVI